LFLYQETTSSIVGTGWENRTKYICMNNDTQQRRKHEFTSNVSQLESD